MYAIPENLKQRLLLMRPTPARITQLFEGLAKAINEQGINDAGITLEFTLDGEAFGEADLIPTITFGLEKAVPTPERPKLELPDGTRV